MKKGLIKVSVLYPHVEGASFDADYYVNKHIPMVEGLLGDVLKGTGVEKGIGGGEPGSPAPNICIGYMLFESVDDFQNAFGPNAEQILADIPNYTTIQPVIQVSEVMA